MNKHKNFVKFVKKTYLTINRLIKNNLNKLNLKNFSKIIRSHKFFLSSCALIILFFSYLLVPNFYDKIELVEKLDNKLQNKLDLKFSLPQKIRYHFLPRPHFILKNSSIIKNHEEIVKIEKLKIYISLNNLFPLKGFKINNLVLEKANFYLDNQLDNFFMELLDKSYKNSELIIKDSNIFFKNNENEVLFINKILNMKYFYDNKKIQNKVISQNETFNLPYSLELKKKRFEKKIFSELNFNFLKLKIKNEFNFNDEVKKGLANFYLKKKKFKIEYEHNDNVFSFNLSDSLEDSNFIYKGEFNFNPFYSKLKGIIKKINILYFLDPNSLMLQLIKTEIFNNKNLNFNLNIYADEAFKFYDFNNFNFNSKIHQGLIDIDDTKFSWKNAANFRLMDSLIYIKDNELILDGKLDLTINSSDQIYKFLLTPKNYRSELKNINVNFVYNFDQKIIYLKDIIINDEYNKDVNKILDNLIFKNSRLQNRIYLKNILNKALKFHAG